MNYMNNPLNYSGTAIPSLSGDYFYVTSFDAVYNYPVLPGCTVKFINTVEPFEYTKTVVYGTNEVVFKIFKLEDITAQFFSNSQAKSPTPEPINQNGSKTDEVESLRRDIDDLKRLMTDAFSCNDNYRNKNYNKNKEEKSE